MRIETRRITTVGKSTGITLSKRVLEVLGVQKGEEIAVITNGDYPRLVPLDKIGEVTQRVRESE